MNAEMAGCALPTSLSYPVPLNERERQAALDALDILDSEPDPRFERLARLTARQFGMPMVRLTFVDRDRTWYKATFGVDACEGLRGEAICAHTILSSEPLVIQDLSRDPRFASLPRVAGPPYLKFYAGAPLVVDGRHRIGSICILDSHTHPDFSDDDIETLKDLAEITVHELELHRQIAKSNADLRQARNDAISADQARERFLGMMSHELRTPLDAVSGLSGVLAAEEFGELGCDQYRDCAQAICEAAGRLDRLVGRVLSYASAREGDLELQESVFDLPKLVRDCTATAAISAALADVEIQLEIAANAPDALLADQVLVVEMLHQLIDNAVKASGPGQVVRVSLSNVEGGLCIAVSDQGTGLAPDQALDFLDAFARRDDGVENGRGSIGIGLPLTQALAALHSGCLLLPVVDSGFRAEIRFPSWRSSDRATMDRVAVS